MNYKKIHIGSLIKKLITEKNIEEERVRKFVKLKDESLENIYNCPSIDIEVLLRFSKLLDFDFFRLYSQHLILYAPLSRNKDSQGSSTKPQFRKNLYTQEIIDFVLDQIESGKMTKKEVIEKYNIPKTTLYKWISKFQKNNDLI